MSGTIDNKGDRIAPLLRGLRRTEGFALYVAVTDVEETARKVETVLQDRLPRPTVSIDCAEMDWRLGDRKLDAMLKQRLTGAPPETVVFLWHLDAHFGEEPSGGEGTQTLLAEMNWRRDFYARLARPLVIWLPERAARRFARGAPDLFDWNSGLYVFSTSA